MPFVRMPPHPRNVTLLRQMRRPPLRRRPRRLRRPLALRSAPTLPPSALSLGKQIAGRLGASGTGIAAAVAVDQLINRIDNPFVTAAVAPVFLGTAAVKLGLDAASAVGSFLGGGEYTAAQIANNRLLVSAGVTPLAAQTNLTRSGTRVVRGTQIQ